MVSTHHPTPRRSVLRALAAAPLMMVAAAAPPFRPAAAAAASSGALGTGLERARRHARGLEQLNSLIVAHHGVVLGVLLASLLFGIMHIDPVQSVGAFVLGLGLHFIYLTTRSLLAPMLVHMLNNTFAFWVIRNYHWCPLPELSPLPDDTQVHTPPGVMIAAIAAAAAVLGLLYQTRTRWLLTTGESESGADVFWSPGYETAEQPPRAIDAFPTATRPRLWLAAAVLISYLALLAALAVESRAVLTS